MSNSREYQVLILNNGQKIWAKHISHDKFIDGIQNGGLLFYGGKRQPILNFQNEPLITEDMITCGGRFLNNE